MKALKLTVGRPMQELQDLLESMYGRPGFGGMFIDVLLDALFSVLFFLQMFFVPRLSYAFGFVLIPCVSTLKRFRGWFGVLRFWDAFLMHEQFPCHTVKYSGASWYVLLWGQETLGQFVQFTSTATTTTVKHFSCMLPLHLLEPSKDPNQTNSSWLVSEVIFCFQTNQWAFSSLSKDWRERGHVRSLSSCQVHDAQGASGMKSHSRVRWKRFSLRFSQGDVCFL